MKKGFKKGEGGRKKGSLNKSTLDIKVLIDKYVEWPAIIQKLASNASAGDEKSAKLLLEYRFGKPVNVEVGGPNGQPIQHEHTINGIDRETLGSLAREIARARLRS